MAKIKKDIIDKAVEEEIKEEVKEVIAPKPTKTYAIPETKEDFLALYQCLKDSGISDLGNLEVKISRL